MKKINPRLVEEIITTLSHIPPEKRPKDPYGNLDVAALNEMSEVKAVVNVLKTMGVKDAEHLRKLGFLAGAMVLRF